MFMVLAATLILPLVARSSQAQPAAVQAGANDQSKPIVIGHRGASGHRPEHTLASYELAIDLGADFIEADLVSTKDGLLVARHENEIGGTTDVASHPEFASRKTTKTIDGASITGWFTEDFTLAELKTLRARERLPQIRPANTAYDGLYEIPTLQEVIDLVKRKSDGAHRRIGIYPETKHPTYFDSIGLSLEEPLVEILDRNGYRGANSPMYIQSFEVGNLRQLSGLTGLPLVQLLDASGRPYDFTVAGDPRTYADLATPDGLAGIAEYADGIGVNKNLIISRDAAGNLLSPTSVVGDAHEAGLIVHAWTFRGENNFLPTNLRKGVPADPAYLLQFGDWRAEYEAFFETGIDGLFADQPGLGIAARDGLVP
jgi:glycerophosphoryl diester phosphodiesterase